MSDARIKTVLKYIIALTIPPVLCAFIMIPLFVALLIATGLLDVCPPKYVILLSYLMDAIAFGASGFIMSLLISSLTRNREIMMTLFGVCIVEIIYRITCFVFICSIDYDFNNIAEGFLKYFWEHHLNVMVLRRIFLFAFALIGAWLVLKKHRLRDQKQ